jgi:hypothetical protein
MIKKSLYLITGNVFFFVSQMKKLEEFKHILGN